MNNYCIIMAGGIGSRFWPLSKDNYPKQFLDILGTGKSFIRSTYERFSPVIPDENFLVVTNKAYKQLVLEHLPMLKPDQVLCEPARRNTAPCIAYAAYHIQSRCQDANIVVTPADHLVTNEVEFQRIIRLGFDFLANTPQALMTIGIKPSRPETGYGYIEVPKQASLPEVVKEDRFKEKPDYETAVKFVSEGNYLWNSGIFLWTLDGIMQAFKTYLPDMVEVFEKGIRRLPQHQHRLRRDGEVAQHLHHPRRLRLERHRHLGLAVHPRQERRCWQRLARQGGFGRQQEHHH